MDIINDFLSHATNSVNVGKFEISFSPVNNLLINLLEKMKEKGYIIYYEVKGDSKKEVYVKFSDIFNKAGAIKPRFPVNYRELEKYEKRYLPARGFGYLIVSTSKGLKTNDECKKERIGGILIAYIY